MRKTEGNRMASAIRLAAGALFLCAGLIACGKSVELGALDPTQKTNPQGGPNVPLACGGGRQVTWRFVQPAPCTKGAVDLLFVVDTSPSLKPERAKIAKMIPKFISQLRVGVDYRIAVMLAHGGASPYSGRLYSTTHLGALVLDSAKMMVPQIQATLQEYLANVRADYDEALGEAGFYSVLKSLEPNRLAEIQSQGFFRPAAALSVVFVADENDICFPPQYNGYTGFPDYVSGGKLEETAFKRYCMAEGQTVSNAPALVYSALSSFKGASPLTLATIAHIDPAKVPGGKSFEDSIGHGYLELVNHTPNGVSIELTSPDYTDGLSKLGTTVQTSLDLLTRFNLTETEPVRAATVVVSVDGAPIASTYDAASNAVEIALKDAGKSGSVVQVDACVGGIAPPPSS